MNPNATCTHCGSTDIISVQGEYFCVNCGQTMAAPKIKATATKRGPGRPKAKRLDQPLPAADTTPFDTVVPVATPVTILAAELVVSAAEPEESAVRTAKPVPMDGLVLKTEAIDDAVEEEPLRPTVSKTHKPKLVLRWGRLTVRSAQAFLPLNVLLTLPGVVALLGVAVGGYIALHRLELGLVVAAGWLVSGLLWLGLARATIMIAHQSVWHHRPLRLRAAWLLGIEYGPRLVGGRIIFLIKEVVLLGLVGVVALLGRTAADWPYYGQIILVFGLSYVLIMLALITWVHHSLLEAAIIQGDLSYRRATKVMMRLPFWRLDVVGSKLGNVVLWLIAGGAISLVGYYLTDQSVASEWWLIATVAAGLTCITGYVVTASVLTGELYQQLTEVVPEDEAAKLTAMARRPRKRHAGHTFGMIAVLLPALLACAVMAWLALA